jgi:excisionase family DNA binding protein
LPLDDDKLYNMRRAAEFLGVHRKTIERHLAKGKIKGVKIGNQWRIKGSEIRRVMEEGSPRSKEEGGGIAYELPAPSDDQVSQPTPLYKPHVDILLASRDKNMLDFLIYIFESEKRFALHTTRSAEKGLELIEQHHIDVVLADQRMVDTTGVAFLARVRALYPDVIRILITAYKSLRVVTDAINLAKVHRYLGKPWNPKEIINAVKEELGARLE